MALKSFALIGAVLSSSGRAAATPTTTEASTLVCGDYVPYGPNYNVSNGNVEFKNSNVDAYGYPNSPMSTQGDYYTATTLNVRTCNSTSLGLHSHVTPKGCDPSGSANCHSVNYIQVLNPTTGYCMTWEKYGVNSNVSFAPCNDKPTTSKQLFKVESMTHYVEFNNPGPLSPLFVGVNNNYHGNWSFFLEPNGKSNIVTIGNSTAPGILVDGFYIATTRK